MSPAARSVFVFSSYLWVLGGVLLLVPNVLLSLFGIPETNEVWVRVVFGLAPPVMIVFGVVDALAAGWTATALRAGEA